jgi:hypothetical protein
MGTERHKRFARVKDNLGQNTRTLSPSALQQEMLIQEHLLN